MSEPMIDPKPSVKKVARSTNSIASIVQSLCRFAYIAQNEADFEAFHALMWELLPSIGLKLDEIMSELGETRSGAFADGTLQGMFQNKAN